MKSGWALAAIGLVACGGAIDSQSLNDNASASQAGDADRGSGSDGSNAGVVPVPAGIPSTPTRPTGASGTTPCAPLDQIGSSPAKLTSSPVIVGRSWNGMPYIIDLDPQRPGQYRAFIGHKGTMERHHVTADETTKGRFIIDRGLPNQIRITESTIEGAGQDGALSEAAPDLLAVFGTVLNDSPESLASAPAIEDLSVTTTLWVVAPIADGAIGVPRVFYGPPDAIAERAFLGFGPPDSYETGTPAASVTFDLDGKAVTLPTIVTRQTAGLINGFGSSAQHFLCF